jgi:RNA polymerase sigma-B factor
MTTALAADAAELMAGVEGLIRRMAGAFAGRGVEAADLEQAARLELWRSIGRFDASRGEFAAFARRAIRGAMLDARGEHRGAVHVPRTSCTLANRWREAERSLAAERGRSPSGAEVAAHLG